ncbi:TfoX/Sxy family transcriptional regulator of competence genes [Nocardioides luteus]|uniref:RNA methyltransferase n=1 Tax=Nocardioides luteus TaxID=1844 RepID=A0ABQ5SW46_9ACTN|nr:TfoX/Sxy family protein [Nocardioides luteus]MDR7309426.1 TfoX/Sxy family transcriptional regulator of competence genes [Nocardioides luteus]GGR51180.1 RNA methyltransferase [Nocardioides luteus]GLJ67833.1 RNA methyltransferase [Nocardioides luteus]
MAYDAELAERVRALMPAEVTEQKMFGALAFMVNGNMACAVGPDDLLVRTGRSAYEAAIAAGAEPMTMGERTMSGYVNVAADLVAGDALADWVRRGIATAQSLPPKPPK